MQATQLARPCNLNAAAKRILMADKVSLYLGRYSLEIHDLRPLEFEQIQSKTFTKYILFAKNVFISIFMDGQEMNLHFDGITRNKILE